MNLRESLEYLAINAFTVYILIRFSHIFFEEIRVKQGVKFIIYLFFYIINSFGYLLFFSPIINICTSVLGIFSITLCYKSSFTKRLTATFLIYGICVAIDIATSTLISKYILGMKVGVINNVIVFLLLFIIELLVEHSVQLEYEFKVFKRYLLELIIIPICSLLIICILVYNFKNMQKSIFFVAILLLFMNIAIFYLYNAVLRNYREKYKNATLEQQLHVYRNQLDTIMQTQNKIRGLKHDMKHHLLTLEHMMSNSYTQESQAYLRNMIGSMNNPNEYSNTGNRDIDSVLNYFIQRAEEKGIAVDTKLNVPVHIEMKFFELNVILSNLLDNAITASEQSQEKKIFFKMELDREILYINIKNSYVNNIIEINGKLQTSKSDHLRHGYGLKNVEAIVEKNHGTLTIDYNDKIFNVGILLYIVDESRN